ncbi:3-ketoacyl-CoA thiolase B, peroxisomal [Chelonia mydas]|uniref:3-ketoacyl-CoA thiolase B, peroxisomal n=1 Tax=Chelonia mydas TaxID=8469 RepID=M7B1V6_CHEMY|nr:3-ketoacyl-CoA thiolase B, peroxisomal [Chelonia mydas]
MTLQSIKGRKAHLPSEKTDPEEELPGLLSTVYPEEPEDLWTTEHLPSEKTDPEEELPGLLSTVYPEEPEDLWTTEDTTPDELLSAVMTAVLTDVSLSPEKVGDICVGNVLQPGAGAFTARISQFLRVETMSLRSVDTTGDVSSRMMDNSKARDCLIPMGAARAQQMGLFKNEIIPVRTTIKDDQGNQKTITVLQDEGIRPSTTLEGLAKLKPAFKENGSTTAGNASQVSDGAAAVLLAKRSKAAQLGLPVLGVLKSYAVVGVPPDVMGIGPAYAIPVALEKAGLTVNDIDIYEINEAFASQVVYCVEKLGIPKEKVNPLGGAIALGHPLGCTGARQVVTLLNELKRRGKRAYGVVSMCIGTGMGAAAVFEYPGK